MTQHSPGRGAVLVTGASTGIGFDAAKALVAHGFRVFGTVRREQDGVELERAGVDPVRLDVTDRRTILAARDRVGELLAGTPLVGLINNAGIVIHGAVELQDLEEFRQVFEVNVVGVVAVTQAFLPLLKKSRGRIVNISSVAANLKPPFQAAYVASKCALETISDCLRRELYPFGVDVVVIQPGSVHSAIWNKISERDASPYENSPYEQALTRMRDGARAPRAMPPARISRAIVHALTAERPATRVAIVGKPWRDLLFSWLPDRWADRIVVKAFWGPKIRPGSSVAPGVSAPPEV